jgi:hypothetical protein
MTRTVLLFAPVLAVLGGIPSRAPGQVTPEQIENGIKKATAYLKGVYKTPPRDDGNYGLGPAALAGLAMLEADVPTNDPSVQNIARAVRERAITEIRTYQISLFVLFLDRLRDPADVPILQLLGVRLLAGQTPAGGWDYNCVGEVQPDVRKRLETNLKTPGGPPGTLHPEVASYKDSLPASKGTADDNSNTQFGLLAVWIARRHGIQADAALARVEQRFRTSQLGNGGWSYNVSGPNGSPAMICVGLLGLATGVARREERTVTAPKPVPTPVKAPSKYGPTPTDPFFDPPPKADKKKTPPKPPPEVRDVNVAGAMTALGAYLVSEVRTTNGRVFPIQGGAHGYKDLYFLWSLERVGVVYGVDRIGGVDWYDAGVSGILRIQDKDGSFTEGGYDKEVNTALALLFLCKSNIVRDLTSSLKKDKDREAPAAEPAPDPSELQGKATALARGLLDAPAGGFAKALAAVRDGVGAEHTRALLLAIGRLDGEWRKQAREALAERLARMTADTLRGMLRSDDPELRRAAVLACAMKADRAHVPDLIDQLTDEEEFVVRAARAGLKSLTGQDHGPENGATKEQKKAAADKWRAATRGKK